MGCCKNNLKNRVAVVVVTYNRLEFLKRCVDSLHKQTVPCDILVVDNASTDETAQWLESQTDIFFHNTGSNLWRCWRIPLWYALGGRGKL